ncbi:SpoIIE family protein phosphatase [Candidatus Poribacteria bacterium]|nr:SpoIIE family protein phosphatase [Candidatus Poribacteria bacterium]
MSVEFLREFINSNDWEQMQKQLEDISDVSVLWAVSDSGRSLLKAEERYFELCQLIRGTEEGLRRCRNSHNRRFQEVRRTGEPAMSPCYCGLMAFALPIILDGNVIGAVGGTHSRAESPITMEKCAEISIACRLDIKDVAEKSKKIKHMPKIEQKRVMSTLTMFTGNLSLLIKWMNRLFLTLNLEDSYSIKLSSISEIGKLAASELNWEEMLKTITGKTKSILDVDACSVYILRHDQQELVLISTDGLPQSVLGKSIKLGEGITGDVAKTRTAASVEDATQDTRTISGSETSRTSRRGKSYKSILSVPLIAQDRLVGVIDVRTFKPKKWLQTDIDFLSIIAAQVAGIIEKDRFRMEINQELEAARFIQARLLPDPLPDVPGYDLDAIIIPNSQVGGDYYDFIMINEKHLGIVIADVSGKGIGAAILMANIQGLVNAYAGNEFGVKDTVSRINQALFNSTESEKFVTMFYSVLDIENGLLTYTNAGHNYPFLCGKDSKECQFLDKGGLMLGMMENTIYSEGSITFKKGDIMILYSDGVTEARNQAGELFGIERLNALVHEYINNNPETINAKDLINHVYQSVCNFSSGISLTDDLTIVAIISK